MTPDGDAAAQRRSQLASLGVAEDLLDELTRATESPYRSLGGSIRELPLEDEPHLEAWRDYHDEAGKRGAAETLKKRLVQLAFPIREGISGEGAYRGAVLGGASPPLGAGLSFADPDSLGIELHPTPAGTVPVIVAPDRRDFESLVRSLTARNEPVDVPASMGACLVRGLVNQDRVRRYRRAWAAERGKDDPAAWKAAFREMAADKAAYQDRVLLLSTGPYSAVGADEAGRDPADWLEESLAIRREHECFHYLTLRLAGMIRSDLLDEVVADLAGLLAARGVYDDALARRFLGLDRLPERRPDARALIYRDDLGDEAFTTLQVLAARATEGLGRTLSERPDLLESPLLPLAAAAEGLPGLASPGLGDRLSHTLAP